MSREKLSAAQRMAVQSIIRAKSDREIARLLRQSHRLLNLHRRRRSTISHRERWTDYELRLLGRIRDEELAKLLRRGVDDDVFPLADLRRIPFLKIVVAFDQMEG